MEYYRINKLKEKLFSTVRRGYAQHNTISGRGTVLPLRKAQRIDLEVDRGRMPSKKGLINAFSLAEILIVLAIMGILIMLVVPNNAGVATRSKSLEAQQELKMVHTLQEAYRMQYSKYSMDLTQLNYIPHKLVTAGGNANYEITVLEASTTGYKAKAEAVVDFNGDGKKNIWEIDQGGVVKEIQPD